ncbi:MAG: PilZ domain-containing protein [Proteobacteria bacterium]|nr:PilZ domain-containing protein [Pseudomonadota bacterium]
MRERIFINSENIATFICPTCNKTRNADVSKIIGAKTAINIKCKCKCGQHFETTLERRRFYRKGIQFKGTCYLGKDNLKLSVIITDISRSGMKIQLNAPHDFNPGDELLIEFQIDDSEKSLISKKIIIRTISGKKLGAEFKSPEHYDKLGSYLMFH